MARGQARRTANPVNRTEPGRPVLRGAYADFAVGLTTPRGTGLLRSEEPRA